MNFHFLLALAGLFGPVLAGKPTNLKIYGKGYQLLYACGNAITSKLHYSAEEYDYSVICKNRAAMATVAGCLTELKSTAADNEYWIRECAKTYSTTITAENITDVNQFYREEAVPLEGLANYTAGELYVPVIFPEGVFTAYHETYKVFYGNYDNAVYFGGAAIGYWGLVCIVSAIANWSLILFPKLRQTTDGKVSRIWRKYVTMPALVHKKKLTTHNFLRIISCLVPSRLESLIIFVFFWLLFLFSALFIYPIEDNKFYDTNVSAINRYVADRTGILCTVLLPLLILFGGRNNFLMWVTRWNFATFITFHRWIARFVTLLAFVHGVCFWRIYSFTNSVASASAETYVTWGIVSLFAGVAILIQGLLYLRRRWYETFLVLHIVLAAFFIIGAWYHIYELGYSQFMYATFAVWAFDRIFRFFRVLYFGFPSANVSLFSDDTIKVEIPRPARWKAIPGGHAYVYFGFRYHFWQSHPFTYTESDSHVTFYCKAKTGVTRSLFKHLSKVPGNSVTMKVGVEGPYGESHPVKHHSDVVFVAGGNGIPGLFSEFNYLNRAADSKQKLKMRWIIREVKSLAWMCEEFEKYRNTSAEITVYVTRPESTDGVQDVLSLLGSNDSLSDDKKSDKDEKNESDENDFFATIRKSLPHVKFEMGRPEIKDIIEGDIEEANNSVAFVVCGSPQMVDEVRYQVVKNIDQTKKRVDFYEAQEVWA